MTPQTEAELRGELELLNRTVAEVLGYQSKEIQGKRFWNKPGTDWWLDLPRFAASLDACRTFEAGLTEEEFWEYSRCLQSIAYYQACERSIPPNVMNTLLRMSAVDHCIAFLKLKGVCE